MTTMTKPEILSWSKLLKTGWFKVSLTNLFIFCSKSSIKSCYKSRQIFRVRLSTELPSQYQLMVNIATRNQSQVLPLYHYSSGAWCNIRLQHPSCKYLTLKPYRAIPFVVRSDFVAPQDLTNLEVRRMLTYKKWKQNLEN